MYFFIFASCELLNVGKYMSVVRGFTHAHIQRKKDRKKERRRRRRRKKKKKKKGQIEIRGTKKWKDRDWYSVIRFGFTAAILWLVINHFHLKPTFSGPTNMTTWKHVKQLKVIC